MTDDTQYKITATGIFGVNTRKPAVQLEVPIKLLQPVMEPGKWGPQAKAGCMCVQMTTDQARSVAMKLLEAAEGALGDGFLLTFLEKEVGMSLSELLPLLLKFRGYRTQQEELRT